MKKTVYLALILIGCGFGLFQACRPQDDFLTDPSVKLRFSSDTLRFDTVFTEIGSATRFIKVFNDYDKPLKISRIRLGSRTTAVFNFNIDGRPSPSDDPKRTLSDIEIPANDSIYVFAEVRVNPDAPLSISPFVIEEDLIFETNGQSQSLILEAWGQNANYIPNRFSANTLNVLNGNGGTIRFDDAKPYVIYGVLFLDSCTLDIAPGTRLHFHGGLGRQNGSLYRDGLIYVLPSARLNIRGTLQKPVIFESDRLEKEFLEEADQWAGIIIGERSTGNVIDNTIIRNARVGIRVDSAAQLTLRNTRIYNTAGSALSGINAQIEAQNSLFYNNGGNGLQIEFGGRYQFEYCTFASLGTKETALSANNIRCYERSGINCVRALAAPLSMAFDNCLFYGSKEDEIGLYDATPDIATDFNFRFNNCILRVKDLLKPDNFPNFFNNCTNCINAKTTDKVFRKASSGDYQLDTLSIAEKKARPLPHILLDLAGRSRDATTPDIGCFEFYPR